MATITGTNGNDTLTGTAESDTINALAGNDLIRPLLAGRAVIDGGAGNDTLDYSNLEEITDLYYSKSYFNAYYFGDPSVATVDKFSLDRTAGGYDKAKNIETVVGSTNKENAIHLQSGDRVDIDLSKNLLKYSAAAYGTSTLTVKNFNNVDVDRYASNQGGFIRVKGNDLDNNILLDRSSIIIGSKGNDTIRGGTIDYSNLGRAVNFVLLGFSSPRGINGSAFHSLEINKNGLGIDKTSSSYNDFRQLQPTIIGAKNKANLLDASTFTSTDRIDVNLANNSLKAITVSERIIINGSATEDFTLVNFVDVIGSKYNDKIVGANKNGKLTGGGGNDTITGGSKNDIITGSDSTARGVGELDTLTGGGGKDKFVLGDKNGAYYVGKGNNDYALITDFNVFQDSISIGSLKDYSFALAGKDTIDLYSGKDIKTRDLIAKIQIAGGISTVSSNAKSAMSPDASLNALVGKINIISG
jgi:Ca2+-binding RTX toxin-like protein